MQNTNTLVAEYLTPKQLIASYAPGLGERFVRDALKDPEHPLPHYRLNRKTILIARSDFDQWIQHYKEDGKADLDSLVEEMCQGLCSEKIKKK